MRRFVTLLIVIALSVLLFVTPVLAAPELPEDPANINAVLLWLMAGGAAPTLAFLFAKWKWFNTLTNNALKHSLVIGAVIGVPLLAKILIDFVPVTAWDVIQPYWAVVVGALLIGYPLSQVVFQRYVKPERDERAWRIQQDQLRAIENAETLEELQKC